MDAANINAPFIVFSADERYRTEITFDATIIIRVLDAKEEGARVDLSIPQPVDLKKQEELTNMLKEAARKLHGNLSTGLVMKDVNGDGIALRGQVSEAMVIAIGDCMAECELMSKEERGVFPPRASRKWRAYSARKGLEGMEKGRTTTRTGALRDAILHHCGEVRQGESEDGALWEWTGTALKDIVENGGDVRQLETETLALLEYAQHANLSLITDQTAWAIADIAKASHRDVRETIRNEAKDMHLARAQLGKALGVMPAVKKPPSVWQRWFGG